MQDVLQFMGVAVLASLIIFMVQLPTLVHQKLGSYIIWTKLLGVVINGIEPYLTALLTVRRIAFVIRLRQRQVSVSDTSRICQAASLDLVMFDKNGILTVNQVTLCLMLCRTWQSSFHLPDCLDNNMSLKVRM